MDDDMADLESAEKSFKISNHNHIYQSSATIREKHAWTITVVNCPIRDISSKSSLFSRTSKRHPPLTTYIHFWPAIHHVELQLEILLGLALPAFVRFDTFYVGRSETMG